MAHLAIETKDFWEGLSAEAARDRRRDKRVPLVYAIEVCGLDLAGNFFCERSRTWNVSERGCCFALRSELQSGCAVAVRVIRREMEGAPSGRALLFQVEWTRPENGRWQVGASSVEAGGLWAVAFPEPV